MSEIISISAVPVSNVTLQAKATNLVEFNDTAVFTCSVSNGTSLSYAWWKGNTTLTAGGNVQINNDGTTLTITNVTRYDQGPFKCEVSNGVSREISPPVHLNISCEFEEKIISISIKKNANLMSQYFFFLYQ